MATMTRNRIKACHLPVFIRRLTKKRDATIVVIADGEGVVAHDIFWSGGTRNTYIACNLASKEYRSPPLLTSPFGGGDLSPTMMLEENEVMIEGGYFLGKPSGLTVYVPEALAMDFAGVPFADICRRNGNAKFDPSMTLAMLRDWLLFDANSDAETPKAMERLAMFYGKQH